MAVVVTSSLSEPAVLAPNLFLASSTVSSRSFASCFIDICPILRPYLSEDRSLWECRALSFLFFVRGGRSQKRSDPFFDAQYSPLMKMIDVQVFGVPLCSAARTGCLQCVNDWKNNGINGRFSSLKHSPIFHPSQLVNHVCSKSSTWGALHQHRNAHHKAPSTSALIGKAIVNR